MNIFAPNFIDALILTRSSFGFLHVIFANFVPEIWPLIYAKFCYRSISREQIDIISPNFIYVFILTRSSQGLLHVSFYTFEP